MRTENKEKTILLVEDDLINARVFSKILTKRGFSVLHTEKPDEMIYLAESGLVDIILMDVSLSRSIYQGRAADGILLTQLLRTNPKTVLIPVVLLTAHAMRNDHESFLLQSGADDYRSKPIVDHQDFVDWVETNLYADPFERLKKHQENLVLIQGYHQQICIEFKQARKKIKDLEEKIEKQKEALKEANIHLQSAELDSLDSADCKKPLLNAFQSPTSHQVDETYKIVCADVVHSLKGEIMNIGSSNQEIRCLSDSSPEIIEECEVIERSLKYSQIRLQKLVDYFSLGRVQVKALKIDELLSEVDSLFRPRLPSTISMKTKIQDGLKEKVILGNLDQLKSVLIELLTNSVKALQGSTTMLQGVDKNIQLIANYEDSKIHIFVKDNGSGVSEDMKDKLFREVVESDRGTGMGLYISSKVIQEMGGELKLESSEEGTTVTVTFAAGQVESLSSS